MGFLSKYRRHFSFYSFQFASNKITDIWINYSAVVHLPQGHGIFTAQQVNIKLKFYCNKQSYFY